MIITANSYVSSNILVTFISEVLADTIPVFKSFNSTICIYSHLSIDTEGHFSATTIYKFLQLINYKVPINSLIKILTLSHLFTKIVLILGPILKVDFLQLSKNKHYLLWLNSSKG